MVALGCNKRKSCETISFLKRLQPEKSSLTQQEETEQTETENLDRTLITDLSPQEGEGFGLIVAN